MLNYHKILSQPSQTKTAKFEHFLTLGAHQSTIRIDPLQSLSLVTLYPESRLTVNQQKIEQGRLTIAISLANNIRINQKIYNKYALVLSPKYINEVQKVQSTFLYIVIKGTPQTNAQELLSHFQEQKQVKLTNQVRIRKVILKKQECLQVNKRILIVINSGKISINSTKQIFQKYACLYTLKGCGTITSIEQSQIFILQFCQNKQ